MSHNCMLNVVLSTYIILIIFFLWLFLLVHVVNILSSTECQRNAHCLLWKWSLLCTFSPVGSFCMQNLCNYYPFFRNDVLLIHTEYIPTGDIKYVVTPIESVAVAVLKLYRLSHRFPEVSCKLYDSILGSKGTIGFSCNMFSSVVVANSSASELRYASRLIFAYFVNHRNALCSADKAL